MRGAISYGQGGQRLTVAQAAMFFALVHTHQLSSKYRVAVGCRGEEGLPVWGLA